jgi:hypothetical protein
MKKSTLLLIALTSIFNACTSNNSNESNTDSIIVDTNQSYYDTIKPYYDNSDSTITPVLQPGIIE